MSAPSHAERQKKYRERHTVYKEKEVERKRKSRANLREAGVESSETQKAQNRLRVAHFREKKKMDKEAELSTTPYQNKTSEKRAVNR
jgi:hypothetical protein